ncbi:MAG: hypothetical protein L0Z62_08055 [Gemmataceae bacterium]|nr:hypothetical protein [Gemmataceae bacterium]
MIVHLHPNLKLLADIAADEHARVGATTAIRVLEEPSGLYRCEATDGKALVIVRGPFDPDDAIVGPLGDEAHVECGAALIHAKDWKEAFNFLVVKHKGRPPMGITLATMRGGARFVSLAGLRPAPEVEGRFPDVNRVLPKHPPQVSVGVDPDLVIRVLRAAAALRADGELAVVLHFWPDPHGGKLGVTLRNGSTGQALDAVFVPLVLNKGGQR